MTRTSSAYPSGKQKWLVDGLVRPPVGWRCWCVFCLAVWSLCARFGWTEEPFKSGEQGILLLEENRVIAGRIRPQPDTYAVDQTAGTLVIAKEKVRHVATDLHSAYVFLQNALPKNPTADDHIDLARWCIGYKLISEARLELETALEIDPSREDIRRNLTKLDSLLKRPPPATEPVKAETPAERFAKGLSGYAVDVESLAGLSREAGQEYTRRIQPILMHNCTASACHGPRADNTFKLTLVRQGSGVMRSTTEKNLLALLPYIDRKNPKSGQLYKVLKSNHGAQGHSIFLGTKGREQSAAVQEWLRSLSTDEDDDEPRESRRSPEKDELAATEQKPRWRKGERPPAAEKSATHDADVHFPPSSTTKRTSSSAPRADKGPPPAAIPEGPDVEPIASGETPETVAEPAREDPFDPDEFNRLQRVKQKLTP